MKICIITPEIGGPTTQEDSAIALTLLAETLTASGHNVTLLCVDSGGTKPCTADQVAQYRTKNTQLVPLPRQASLRIVSPDFMRRPYEAYLWLKQHTFDVIHYPDFMALGHYVSLAKHQGLGFAETLLCVHAHGPSLWRKHIDYLFPRKVGELGLDFMERQSVTFADILVSPSSNMIEWMKQQGWGLPRQIYVRQNLAPPETIPREATTSRPWPVRNIVFFGNLLPHKGLELFCDALDRLAPEKLQETQITFLGKGFDTPAGRTKDLISWRARKWKFDWQIFSKKTRGEALTYLRQHSCLAVIPSRDDNSPYEVLECLANGIPFIATNVGGIPELVASEDRDLVLCPPRADRLAEKINTGLREGIPAARPALDFKTNRQDWIDWHAGLALPEKPSLPEAFTKQNAPLVSVCICHHNRPRFLQQALQSIYRQDYPNIEIVLVDDASTDAEALKLLDTLTPEFQARGWQIIRLEKNLYQGAATNCAVRAAHGVYVKLMDDDNISELHEVSTFVRVAQKTGADIVTCIVSSFAGDEEPRGGDPTEQLCLLVGPSVSVGAFQNGFGDNNSLVKRSAWLELGGLSEIYGAGNTDWEFLARAVLKGYRLEVIPEILYRYRRSPTSMSQTTPYYSNSMLNLRAYLDHLPPAFRPLMWLAYGMSKGIVLLPGTAISWKRPLASLWLIKQRLIKAYQALHGRI